MCNNFVYCTLPKLCQNDVLQKREEEAKKERLGRETHSTTLLDGQNEEEKIKGSRKLCSEQLRLTQNKRDEDRLGEPQSSRKLASAFPREICLLQRQLLQRWLIAIHVGRETGHTWRVGGRCTTLWGRNEGVSVSWSEKALGPLPQSWLLTLKSAVGASGSG